MNSTPNNHKRWSPVWGDGLAAALLLALICLLAWPGMRAPLFSDDIFQLAKSKQFHSWTEVFGTDVFGFFRPVKNALFMAAAPLENHLVAWHWVGLFAYLAATLGVFRMASICLVSRRAAWLAAGLWALSPACVSTAIWLSCANISIGLVFAACVLHFHERWALRPSPAALVACVLGCALALLCYETLIAIPALLFIRDVQQRRLGYNRRTFILYGAYSLVVLAFLLLRYHLSARNIGDYGHFHPGFSPDTQAIHLSLSAPWFLWRHFLMWVFPFGTLEVFGSYGWMRSASAASLVFGWLFLLGLCGTAALTWKRFPAIAYGLLFFVVASLPSGNFLPCFNGPIIDAYVTIPSVGLAMVLAVGCELLLQQVLQRRREAGSGVLAYATVLCLLLIYRVPVCGCYFRYWAGVWAHPVELLLLSSETRPFQFQPKSLASVLLFTDGYFGQAEAIANEVIQEAPWNLQARLTLARIAAFRQDFTTAESSYRFILGAPSKDVLLNDPAHLELANLLSQRPNRREEAAQICREMVANDHGRYQSCAIALLAKIYKDQDNPAKARSTLELGLSLYPHNEALENMLKAIIAPGGS